jgi:putative OPT family oligopeptide transporter
MIDRSAAPAAGRRVEITLRVVVLGLLLAVVMGAANVYVGLKAGMTVSASIPAAVVAMLLFRTLFSNSSILEANQVQTCASAGESLAAGIIFTMPALVMIGYWGSFDFWSVTCIAMTGGLLGILFMIPMRKVFVADNDELPYPEGVACAAVLEAGQQHAPGGEGRRLVLGGLLGAVFALGAKLFGVFSATLEAAAVYSSRTFYFGGDLSPMLVAVGFIVRLHIAVLIFLGGALSWLIAIPLYGGGDANDAVEGAYAIWSSQIRFVGVGAMVVAGLASLFSVRRGLVAAVTELRSSLDGARELHDHQRDIPAPAILVIGLLCVVSLALVNYHFTGGVGITLLATTVMLLMGFFFTAVASYIVGLVGNSNSPVSGMTITAVLVAGGLLWLFNYSGMDAMVATLGIAAIVCCVACTSGDVCNDLKTGSLVGAAPYRQQMMQIAGVMVAALVMAPVLTLLHENTPGGIGGRELAAPQASLFAALARGFAGNGTLPWNMIGYGVAVGIMILGVDWYLRLLGMKFRAHLMPIAVGMYLPFGLAVPILIGGLIAYFHTRGRDQAEHTRALHGGVLFSSGVIAGEALMSVGLACMAALGIQSMELGLSPAATLALSSLGAIAVVICFMVVTRPGR